MTRSFFQKSLVLTGALFASTFGLMSSADAQIFGGNRILFQNRCIPNPCCPPWQQTQAWQHSQPMVYQSTMAPYSVPSNQMIYGGDMAMNSVQTFGYVDQVNMHDGISATPGISQQTSPMNEPSGDITYSGQEIQRHQAYSVPKEMEVEGKSYKQLIEKQMNCFIACKLALANESIVSKVETSKEKLNSSVVQNLAAKIKESHSELAETFHRFAHSQNLGDVSHAEGGTEGERNLGPYAALLEICEIADKKHQEDFRKMMSEYSEEEVEMAFVGSKIICYRSMLAELNAAKRTVECSELKSKLDETIVMFEKHLEKTEEVYEEIRRDRSES